jgi:hypothetical protein
MTKPEADGVETRQIRIFVASPGDVSEERQIVTDVASEINRTDGKDKKYLLTVLKWEDDTYPALGDPQTSITKQIGEYEVFVGLMWQRYGTATKSADSGTQEEFDNAYRAWQANPARPVMFYFRQQPGSGPKGFSAQQLKQLAEVAEFKERVEKVGYVREYQDPPAFREKLAVELRRAINDYLANTNPSPPAFSVFLGKATGAVNLVTRDRLARRLTDLPLKIVGDAEFEKSDPSKPLVAVHFADSPASREQCDEIARGVLRAKRQIVRVQGPPQDGDPLKDVLSALDRSRVEVFSGPVSDAPAAIEERISKWQEEEQAPPATKLFIDIAPDDLANVRVLEFMAFLDSCQIDSVLRDSSSHPLVEFNAKIPLSKVAVFVYAGNFKAFVETRLMQASGIAATGPRGSRPRKWGVFLAPSAKPTDAPFELDYAPKDLKYMDNIDAFNQASVQWIVEEMHGRRMGTQSPGVQRGS